MNLVILHLLLEEEQSQLKNKKKNKDKNKEGNRMDQTSNR